MTTTHRVKPGAHDLGHDAGDDESAAEGLLHCLKFPPTRPSAEQRGAKQGRGTTGLARCRRDLESSGNRPEGKPERANPT